MKTISFYNEKGGVGKSNFSVMYASWLHYKHGIDVAYVDFNGRQEQFRADEIANKKVAGVWEGYDENTFWPIITAKKFEIQKKYPSSKAPNAMWLRDETAKGSLKGKQVTIIDLPGATAGREFIELYLTNSIGVMPVIIDREQQTMRAAMSVFRTLSQNKRKTIYFGFINQIQSYIPIREYDEVKNMFMKMNMPILPDGISFSERVRNIANPEIMRSTVTYPNWGSKAFEGSRDLGTENLFIDITRILNKSEDYPGTEKTDISFADTMTKEFQEKRQFTETAFPEYEFDKSMFPESRFAKSDE